MEKSEPSELIGTSARENLVGRQNRNVLYVDATCLTGELFQPYARFFYWRSKASAFCEAVQMLEPDAQLVQRCLRGDGSAWEWLVQNHTRRIYNICYRFTGSRHEAQDLTQEVFLRVYRTLGSYRPEQGTCATWMTTVTRNLLIDHYRRTKRERLTDSLDDAPQVEQKIAPGRLPDQAALDSELSVQVQLALLKVSPELREAVILRDLQGLEYAEIQQVLEVPVGTVKSRISRGRIELAKHLESMGIRPA
jgi:RNA polymerase sigma-70 factor (ECF subfamily)